MFDLMEHYLMHVFFHCTNLLSLIYYGHSISKNTAATLAYYSDTFEKVCREREREYIIQSEYKSHNISADYNKKMKK